MLKLTSEAANAAYITGDFDNMNTLINEVLNIKGISVKDKFRVYEVKILAEQGKKILIITFVHILCTFSSLTQTSHSYLSYLMSIPNTDTNNVVR